MTELWAVILVIIATLIGSGGALLLKISSNKLKLSIKGIFKNKALIFGGILYLLSTIIFVTALRGGSLNVIYPITSAGYIWIAILSKMYLKERMNLYKIIGMLLILFGIITITS